MIGALLKYSAWERDAAAAADRFPLPPTATERQCAAALDALPEHPVQVHLFTAPKTTPSPIALGPAQLVAALVGSMAARYRDEGGVRVSRARYRVHENGTVTPPAECVLLERELRDGSRASVVLDVYRDGGVVQVSLGSVCRARYGLGRWLAQWGMILLPALLVPLFIGLPLVIVGPGLIRSLGALVFVFLLAIPFYLGLIAWGLWNHGVVASADDRQMPPDGANFVALTRQTFNEVLNGRARQEPLPPEDAPPRVRARPVTPPADPTPEPPPVRDDDRD